MTLLANMTEAPARRGLAMLLMVVSSVGISFGGLIVRSMDGADAWQINFYRSLSLAAVVMGILIYRYRGNTATRIRGIGWPGLMGGASLSVAGICYLQALNNTTVANTLFVLSAIPFFTAALAWLILSETLRRETVVTMIFAAIGVGIMVADGIGAGSAYGNVMALITALGFSGFAVIVRANRQVDMLPSLLVSSIIILVLSTIIRWGDLGISAKDIMLSFLWGGVLSGIGNAMFIFASRHLVAAELTLFMLLEFALGPLWVWVGIGETPTRWTLFGGAVVILAVTVRAVLEIQRGSARMKRSRPAQM